MNQDVIVPPSYIHFGEYSGIFEFIEKVGYTRKGVGVLDGVFIEVPIILDGL
jgi:hypothetical protein